MNEQQLREEISQLKKRVDEIREQMQPVFAQLAAKYKRIMANTGLAEEIRRDFMAAERREYLKLCGDMMSRMEPISAELRRKEIRLRDIERSERMTEAAVVAA